MKWSFRTSETETGWVVSFSRSICLEPVSIELFRIPRCLKIRKAIDEMTHSESAYLHIMLPRIMFFPHEKIRSYNTKEAFLRISVVSLEHELPTFYFFVFFHQRIFPPMLICTWPKIRIHWFFYIVLNCPCTFLNYENGVRCQVLI